MTIGKRETIKNSIPALVPAAFGITFLFICLVSYIQYGKNVAEIMNRYNFDTIKSLSITEFSSLYGNLAVLAQNLITAAGIGLTLIVIWLQYIEIQRSNMRYESDRRTQKVEYEKNENYKLTETIRTRIDELEWKELTGSRELQPTYTYYNGTAAIEKATQGFRTYIKNIQTKKGVLNNMEFCQQSFEICTSFHDIASLVNAFAENMQQYEPESKKHAAVLYSKLLDTHVDRYMSTVLDVMDNSPEYILSDNEDHLSIVAMIFKDTKLYQQSIEIIDEQLGDAEQVQVERSENGLFRIRT